MGKQTSHVHPNMPLYKLQQISFALLFVAAIIAAFLSIVGAIAFSQPQFIIMRILMCLLSAPLLMMIVNTSPITIYAIQEPSIIEE